jgi:transcriptional regulator with XRE-family HTH domain
MTHAVPIRSLLLRAGWRQSDLAKKLRTDQSTVSRWLKGAEPMGELRTALENILIEYGLGVSPRANMTASRRFPVTGFIVEGAVIDLIWRSGGGVPMSQLQVIETPFSLAALNCGALIAKANSQYPRVKEGEVVIYDVGDASPDDLLGKEAVVQLANGDVYLKTLRAGRGKGLYTLDSHNAPPLYDQKIAWCGRVISIVLADAWAFVTQADAPRP